LKSEILNDIDYLAESNSQETFNKLWLLIKKSWLSKGKQEINDFTNYFEGQYIKKNSNWYLGSCPIGFGNFNNALEGFNCAFKKNFSNYERQDIVNNYFYKQLNK